MTKRYTLDLCLYDNDGDALLRIHAEKKTMETVQQLVRVSMSDFEKVDPMPPQKRRWGKSRRVDPPIEVIGGPSEDDIKGV